MHMLPQVDRPPIPLSQHLDELIGAELLSDIIWHLRTSCDIAMGSLVFPLCNVCIAIVSYSSLPAWACAGTPSNAARRGPPRCPVTVKDRRRCAEHRRY